MNGKKENNISAAWSAVIAMLVRLFFDKGKHTKNKSICCFILCLVPEAMEAGRNRLGTSYGSFFIIRGSASSCIFASSFTHPKWNGGWITKSVTYINSKNPVWIVHFDTWSRCQVKYLCRLLPEDSEFNPWSQFQ